MLKTPPKRLFWGEGLCTFSGLCTLRLPFTVSFSRLLELYPACQEPALQLAKESAKRWIEEQSPGASELLWELAVGQMATGYLENPIGERKIGPQGLAFFCPIASCLLSWLWFFYGLSKVSLRCSYMVLLGFLGFCFLVLHFGVF